MTCGNEALGDESLAAKFIAGLSDENPNQAAAFFGAEAKHLEETAHLYEFTDAKELFDKIKQYKNLD